MFSAIQKVNFFLSIFGFFKVPLIWLCRPKIIQLDSNTVEVKIPLKKRTKNHLNSMYFGALAIGADVAGGVMAMDKTYKRGGRISLAFKGVKAEFLKRPEDDVHFICHDGKLIDEMLNETFDTGKRVNETVTITATCPSLYKDEPMAVFELILSIKAIKPQ